MLKRGSTLDVVRPTTPPQDNWEEPFKIPGSITPWINNTTIEHHLRQELIYLSTHQGGILFLAPCMSGKTLRLRMLLAKRGLFLSYAKNVIYFSMLGATLPLHDWCLDIMRKRDLITQEQRENNTKFYDVLRDGHTIVVFDHIECVREFEESTDFFSEASKMSHYQQTQTFSTLLVCNSHKYTIQVMETSAPYLGMRLVGDLVAEVPKKLNQMIHMKCSGGLLLTPEQTQALFAVRLELECDLLDISTTERRLPSGIYKSFITHLTSIGIIGIVNFIAGQVAKILSGESKDFSVFMKHFENVTRYWIRNWQLCTTSKVDGVEQLLVRTVT